MMKKNFSYNLAFISLICFSLVNSSCENYTIPKPALPTTSAQADNINLDHWWKKFKDPNLNKLLNQALANNNDVLIAKEQINQSKAALISAQSSYFPSLGIDATSEKTKHSTNSNSLISGSKDITHSNTGQFSAAYEIDLWGRLSSLRKAAQLELAKTNYAKSATQNAVSTQVVKSYFTLVALKQDQKLLQNILNAYNEILALEKKKLQAGLIANDEFFTSQAARDNIAAQLATAQASSQDATIALSVLVGASPKQISENKLQTIHNLSQITYIFEVPQGLPAKLLLRRPDIMAAESQLLAYNANVAAARSEWFPTISLTGLLGGQSTDLANLMNQSSRTWNVAATIAQPNLNPLTTIAKIRNAKSLRKQAEITYEQAVRQAFADALTTLNDHMQNRKSMLWQKSNFTSNEKIFTAHKQQFDAGLIDRISLLNAKINKLQAERKLLASQQTLLIALANLCQALGGGW